MLKFYKALDGKIVINDPDGEEIIPNTVEAAFEKHIPVIEHSGDHVIVKVGSIEHPSIPEHYIEFIILETTTGYQKKELKPGEKPEVSFAVTEPVVAAYEHCNLHGLWVAKARYDLNGRLTTKMNVNGEILCRCIANLKA